MMEQMSRIATVTDIRKIDDKRFCLFVDYEPFSSVYASDIRRLHLACDGEIEWSKLEKFRRDYLFKRAMNKAVNSIKFRTSVNTISGRSLRICITTKRLWIRPSTN